MEHPKHVGDRSTLAILSAFHELGYGVYMPFGENTRVDLIIERDGELARVQCKTGRLRGRAIVFAVCSTYGHHRNPRVASRTYIGQIDYFAVYCPETQGVYLVPIEDVATRSRASLRIALPRNNQREKVRFAFDYEIAWVLIEGLRVSSGA
jgi:hypothetical protein